MPNISDDQWHQADAMMDKGQYSEATALYSEMIRQSSSDPHLLALRGYAFYRLGDPVKSLADFDAALNLKPDAPNTLFMRAKSKELLNDLDGAIADYRKVIGLAPDTADAYSGIAMIYEFRGDIVNARLEHGRATSIDPDILSSANFFQKYGK